MSQAQHTTGDRVKAFLKTDRAILMISISIAFVFWLLTEMSGQFRTEREVGINYELPEGKIFLNTPPSKIMAEVEGKGWTLFFDYIRGRKSAISLQLDSTDTQYLTSPIISSRLSSELGDGYEVKTMGRDVITIRLDKPKEKQVPVIPHVEIHLAPGFMYSDSIQITPEQFTLIGPESIIEGIPSYPTESLVWENVAAGFMKKVKAKPPNNKQLRILPDEVSIVAQVERYTEGELVIPIEILNAPDSISIYPERVFVKYRAPLSRFPLISTDDFSVIANLIHAPPSSPHNTLALNIGRQPPFTKIVSIQPPTIEYYLQK